MRIVDIPRPWLLAAVTGVPMAALLRRAEEEAEQHEAAPQDPACDEKERPSRAEDRVRARGDRVLSLLS